MMKCTSCKTNITKEKDIALIGDRYFEPITCKSCFKKRNQLKCSECNYTKDIRAEETYEPDGTILIYFRCKNCGFEWDNGE